MGLAFALALACGCAPDFRVQQPGEGGAGGSGGSGGSGAGSTTVADGSVCSPSCGADQDCVKEHCISRGALQFTVTWSRPGDADLFVTTPGDDTIYWENMGPDLGTDGGRLEHPGDFGEGPENVVWDGDEEPEYGQYSVCFLAGFSGAPDGAFEPPITASDPLDFTVTVSEYGSVVERFEGSFQANTIIDDENYPDCTPIESAYVGWFLYLP
ncbi:Hypothetical protein CAP_4746 [Chondromyces apiculatus DSM 436]|uniref:Uncharacterized protein n=1 Tax=Chondromyces apiculatus DSM 436 TaxID=1192034 RepID=A0A017T4V7_9BACT|nr:Hypothetical protein CAP_4746 [Chondromyces apiculatus DSM 436]